MSPGREKQGTVEHGHGVVKSELAGGTMPCGRFGANAAWWRLNVLVHNLLWFMKATTLPRDMAPLRPKALRLRLLNVVGILARHARRLVLRVSSSLPDVRHLARARPCPIRRSMRSRTDRGQVHPRPAEAGARLTRLQRPSPSLPVTCARDQPISCR